VACEHTQFCPEKVLRKSEPDLLGAMLPATVSQRVMGGRWEAALMDGLLDY